MTQLLLAGLFVVLAWWASTALVLRLVWVRPAARAATMVAAALLATFGAVMGWWASAMEDAVGAYAGFVAGLSVWGVHELSFLFGFVTGPRKEACPPGARGWQRFRLATATVIHHELALALTLGGLVLLTWGRPNPVMTMTFGVLWVMRVSAKLNIFLGIRNISAEFVPHHLRYLVTYFRSARLNPLMPFSLVGSAALTTVLAAKAASVGEGPVSGVGYGLVAALLGLACIEHVFLAIRLPDARLWRWVLSGGSGSAQTGKNVS